MRYKLAVLLIIPLLFSCSKQEKQTKKEPDKPRAIEVSVVKPVKKPFYKTYKVPAYLETDLDLNIKPEISGKIVKIDVEEGDFVKKGQILAQVETFLSKEVVSTATLSPIPNNLIDVTFAFTKSTCSSNSFTTLATFFISL